MRTRHRDAQPTHVRTLTAAEQAEIAAVVRAHFGGRYDEVCRGVYARSRIARHRRERAEAEYWASVR